MRNIIFIYSFVYGIYFISANLNTITTTMILSPTVSLNCDPSTQIQFFNNTCCFKMDLQMYAVDILRNETNNTAIIGNALSLYIAATTNANISWNPYYILSPNEIEEYLSSLNNFTLFINSNTSFIMTQPVYRQQNITTQGAFYTHNIGGQVIDSSNINNISNLNLTAAVIIPNQSLVGATYLSMLIIDKPTTYENIDNSTNQILASSVIVVSLQRNSSSYIPINISLYFQVVDDYKPTVDAIYSCTFYDLNLSQWNGSGCTVPIFNALLNQYECSCNHLSTFALVWQPNVPDTHHLDAQDIASLVFESISIVCFLIIIIHAIIMQSQDSLMHLRAYDLLPLISSASATILFIFHIALEMTVYTKTSSNNQAQCFLSSNVLLFFVYFFLIFMFCTKTSVGYFNYLRFVHLFSEPPPRALWTMLVISFLISITWVAFAAGFSSRSSFNITQLYPYKLCWFTRNMIYFFLTIPVSLFILTNIIVSILVGVHIINHVRNATSLYQSYDRMKRCVIVLLSSCLTHGIGWLFGPFLTFANPTPGEVLGWLFIVFNGLEGLWAIILYLIIRSQNIHEHKCNESARKRNITSCKNVKYRTNQTKSSQIINTHDFIICY